MDRSISLVRVDKRRHRAIAKENWGLTDEQMAGMHVHHRIARSKGGTNDPSNLYVCSPSFHAYAWHGPDSCFSLIKFAEEGGKKGGEAMRRKIKEIKSLGQKCEWAQKRGKKAHEKHRGTPAYSEAQRLKSLRAAVAKRRHWNKETYENAWKLFVSGASSGYLIAKALGEKKWKMYENMRILFSSGYTFEQITDPDLYIIERKRLEKSSISHIIKAYND
jgi:hypothetical protein